MFMYVYACVWWGDKVIIYNNLMDSSFATNLTPTSPFKTENDAERHTISVRRLKRELITEYEKMEVENPYCELPSSTHTLLITEPIWSFAFLFSLLIALVSLACLILVLSNNVSNSESGTTIVRRGRGRNPLSIPAGVSGVVWVAQYLGETVTCLCQIV